MSKLFAVFGNPVLHSKSPQLFNSVFENSHVDAYYTRIRVDKSEDIIRSIRLLNIIGSNVTTPYKETVLPLLDELSPDAEQIGAVNTILNDNGHLKGYNTDYLGVIKSIEEAGIEISGKRCLILGAGGASRAAVYGLKKSGADVYIANRTVGKSIEIANKFGCMAIDFDDIREFSDIDLVISTLLPNVFLPDISWDRKIKLFLDANYRKSMLFEDFQRIKVKVLLGDRWLIHQAIESFSIFTGFEPSLELLNESININLDYSNARAKYIDLNKRNDLNDERFDLLVAAGGLNDKDITRIIDEEKCKAINC